MNTIKDLVKWGKQIAQQYPEYKEDIKYLISECKEDGILECQEKIIELIEDD
jgi:hypothetical protein